jgi:hypothetical protein
MASGAFSAHRHKLVSDIVIDPRSSAAMPAVAGPIPSALSR